MSSVEHFDPNGLDDDIYGVEVHGLGRGRGFETGPRESILGDDKVTPLIKDRILDIALFLMKNGDLDEDEVFSKLELDEGQERSEEPSEDEAIDGMVDKIDEALGEGYAPEVNQTEDPIGALEERVNDLVNDYESATAEVEESE